MQSHSDQNDIELKPLELLNHHFAKTTQNLVLFGASGSVGSTVLNYLKQRPEIKLSAITVHSSIDKLRSILSEQSPSRVAITNLEVYKNHRNQLERDYSAVKFYGGEEGALEMLKESHAEGADTVVTALMGADGIRATLLAIQLKMKIALANKETMVTAGPIIEKYILDLKSRKESLPVFLPVDSEHNSIFQLLAEQSEEGVSRIILTASGGPFRDLPPEKLSSVKREEVLNHPTWQMGPKITVDSAGMINKGLEVIEARFLFSLPYNKLDVLIHRQSLVHAMIENSDGGYHLSASHPDMVFPVAHALHYPMAVPRRHPGCSRPAEWQPLTFEEVPRERYPGYYLSLEAARTGHTAPAILNAANEAAVELFLNGKIKFVDIPPLINMALERIKIEKSYDLDIYIEADRKARQLVQDSLKN